MSASHGIAADNSSDASAREESQAGSSDEKSGISGEDFAAALETFTTEAEEAVSEDRVIKGTVLKLTGTHVVVDIGAKSEGMLPLSKFWITRASRDSSRATKST